MKGLWVAILAIFVGSAALAAQPQGLYFRFWRGWKRPELAAPQFVGDLNRIFVPATVVNGAGKGLVAYLPALLPKERAGFLPDEVALVVYRDQSSYQAIGATPEGQRYALSHWKYFDRSKSSSRVPQAYDGGAAYEQAYDLSSGPIDWQAADASLSALTRTAGVSDAAYLAAANGLLEKLRGQDALALVAREYILVYSAGTRSRALESSALTSLAELALTHQSRGATHLAPGMGIDVNFER